MKANIKLPILIPVIAVFSAVLLGLFTKSWVVIIIGLGALYLVVYFAFGFIKREDALVIEGNTMKVITPFKSKLYFIDKLSNLELLDNGSILKADYEEDSLIRRVSLCGNIYSVSLIEIYEFLIKKYNFNIEDETLS